MCLLVRPDLEPVDTVCGFRAFLLFFDCGRKCDLCETSSQSCSSDHQKMLRLNHRN
jgi:hypothetical protein